MSTFQTIYATTSPTLHSPHLRMDTSLNHFQTKKTQTIKPHYHLFLPNQEQHTTSLKKIRRKITISTQRLLLSVSPHQRNKYIKYTNICKSIIYIKHTKKQVSYNVWGWTSRVAILFHSRDLNVPKTPGRSSEYSPNPETLNQLWMARGAPHACGSPPPVRINLL